MKKGLSAGLLALIIVGAQAQETLTFFQIPDLSPKVVNFTSQEEALKLAVDHRVVYFFAADWCALCQASLKSLRANINLIPEDVRIILVDFDHADELRIKYQIPLQDVFLQIDSTGQRSALWVGGGYENLKRKIKGQDAVQKERS